MAAPSCPARNPPAAHFAFTFAFAAVAAAWSGVRGVDGCCVGDDAGIGVVGAVGVDNPMPWRYADASASSPWSLGFVTMQLCSVHMEQAHWEKREAEVHCVTEHGLSVARIR
jgi:hypothetical protein